MVQILKFEVGKGFPVPDCGVLMNSDPVVDTIGVSKECSWKIGSEAQYILK